MRGKVPYHKKITNRPTITMKPNNYDAEAAIAAERWECRKRGKDNRSNNTPRHAKMEAYKREKYRFQY